MREKKQNPFKAKTNVAFVVEGECEFWYLNMLKRNEKSIQVNIEPKIPQKKKLKEQFDLVKQLSKDNKKVFWIVDFDVILKETKDAKPGTKTRLQEFVQYKKTLEQRFNNVAVIVNNPCLEYWLLLHFEATAKPFHNCEEAGKQLKKHLPDYEKKQGYYTRGGSDIYLKLNPRLEDAIKKAKQLGAFNEQEPEKSISEMFLLFESDEFKHLLKG